MKGLNEQRNFAKDLSGFMRKLSGLKGPSEFLKFSNDLREGVKKKLGKTPSLMVSIIIDNKGRIGLFCLELYFCCKQRLGSFNDG